MVIISSNKEKKDSVAKKSNYFEVIDGKNTSMKTMMRARTRWRRMRSKK